MGSGGWMWWNFSGSARLSDRDAKTVYTELAEAFKAVYTPL